jgi:mRNA-degrading endonuclease toxin of MazEF toxin-antitoxin module
MTEGDDFLKNYYATNAANATSIAQFNNIYFGVPHNRFFKLHFISQWMEFYGYWLTKEKEHDIPKYYTTFNHGSVVMVNFGPNIGSELSGNHFAIVLNRKDKRENKTLTVLSLSSKDHSNYLDLGNELFKSIYQLTQQRMADFEQEKDTVIKMLNTRIKELTPKILSYKLIDESSKNASTFFAKDSLNGFLHIMHEFQINFADYIDFKDPTKLKELINEIVNIREKEIVAHSSESYIERLSSTISDLTEFYNGIESGVTLNEHIDNMQGLIDKVQKYSKNTYAIIPNITTVSKLRVVKVSHYTISKNVTISEESLARIHKSVKNYLSLND